MRGGAVAGGAVSELLGPRLRKRDQLLQRCSRQRRVDADRAHVEEIDLTPFLETAKLLYSGPWVAERYQAIRAFIETGPERLLPVIREIIVLPPRRRGIGRKLMQMVQARAPGPVVARCPVAYESNRFWPAVGFVLACQEKGANVWQWQRPA